MNRIHLVSLSACLLFAAADAAARSAPEAATDAKPLPRVEGIVTMPYGQAGQSQARQAPDFRAARSVLPILKALPAQAFDFNAAAALGRTAVQADEAGHAGSVDARGLALRLPDEATAPAVDAPQAPQAAPATRRDAVGTQGLQFTSSQVFPSQVDTSYPHRATGKLWFETSPGQWSTCSASMIKPGIVATAGHCVASGTGRWYGSFVYVPAYRSGSAPYGVWSSWATVTTTNQWFTGGGTVPNGGDYGLIIFHKNAAGYRIGDYTGWLGYQFPALVGKHVTVLGYPGNLDGGAINHRVDAQTTAGAAGTGLFGSDMTGGSSGGAVVLNFRTNYSSSTSAPADNGENRLVSVVSYGPVATGPKYQGGSVFDARLTSMLSSLCTGYAWAC
jgi:V8-like Glu-specific endopeptidase